MGWGQVGLLAFLIFAVGWVVEARLETLIKEVFRLRLDLQQSLNQIDASIHRLGPYG